MVNLEIRPLVRGAYDIQKLRIAMGLRIVAQFKVRIGQAPSTPEKELDKKGQLILANLRKEFKLLTDGVIRLPAKLPKKAVLIDSYSEFAMIRQYEHLFTAEKEQLGQTGMLRKCLNGIPIWEEFLKGVTGCGPAMSGVIISELDIHKAEYPSSFWKYCGIDVSNANKNGERTGRTNQKHHLVDVEYTDKDGEVATRKSITYNPFVKTKIVGVLGGCLMKQNKHYKKIYDDYKNRLQNTPRHAEKTPLHIHNMSNRYMIKRFLVDLHLKWRALEGLKVNSEYSEGKLGMKHRGGK